MRPPARSLRSAATTATISSSKVRAAKPVATAKGKSPSALVKPEATTAGVSTTPLIELGELVAGVVVQRPSARNKSPYVGDVRLNADGRVVIAHMPSMDCGGKCCPGAAVMLKPSRDKKGALVGADALGPYGTPKCEFIMQLLRVDEPENAHLGGVWIGAHPSLGEKIAQALLERQLIPALPAAEQIQREVAGVAGCDMRCDFLLSHGPSAKTVVEVKTVVDTDYAPETAPERKECRFIGRGTPYRRAAIFPWGRSGQKGPDGEAVVSARAIKHVDELAAIARGKRRIDGVDALGAAVLFVVIRRDAHFFRPNDEACASFARHLRAARDAGVTVTSRRVRWGEGDDVGRCFDDGECEVRLDD